MAANINPDLSNVTEESEKVAPSLPVVRVLPTQHGKSVEVKFDEIDATTAPLDRVYTNEPYNFRAIFAGGREPRVKTFGSLIACNGGTLIIGENQYRIQVVEQQPVSTQQQPVSIELEKFKPALEYAQQQLEAKTVHKAMSKASYEFARLLLSGLSIDVKIDVPDVKEGSAEDPRPYSWTIETKDNETMKKGEHQGTPGEREWFKQNFFPYNGKFCLEVVTNKELPTLKGNQKSTTGKGDLVVGIEKHLKLAVSPYEQAYGLVELKTGEYRLKPAQNVLQLASLATISRLGKSVALLATDCDTKWELCYFKDPRTIVRRDYEHGGKCWEDFRKLLDDAESTSVEEPPRSRYKQTLPTSYEENNEDEQNLDGFHGGLGDGKDDRTEAIERHAMLDQFANQLAEIYGDRPSIPEWARVEATCPDYYL